MITQFKYQRIYRRPMYVQYDFKTRVRRLSDLTLRIILLMAWPLVTTIPACYIWYFFFYVPGLHIESRTSEIAAAAWLPIFGVLYALLAAVAINTVFTQFVDIRYAIKTFDIDRFMLLRDQDLTPVFHAAMTMTAIGVIFGFMWMDYPNPGSGFLFVGSTTYLFSLMYQVISELDNPCTGIWFIRSIPHEWLRIDPKLWLARKEECAKVEKRVQEFLDEVKRNSIEQP